MIIKKYKDIDIYDFSDYAEEITGNALFKINGGAEVENSHEGVAGASVGDTITRKDGTVVTLKQADIDYAKTQLGNTGNTNSGNSGGNSGAGSPVVTGNTNISAGNDTSQISSSVPDEIKSTPQAYAYYMALQGRANEEGKQDPYPNGVESCENWKNNSLDFIRPLGWYNE